MLPVKQVRNISKKHNWLVLTLGIILGVFIVLSTQPAPKEQAPDLTEQQPDKEDTTLSAASVEAVQGATQAPVERNSYLIEILPSIEISDKEEVREAGFLPSPEKVFKVLFRHIISPNSP